jgi:hypothetical protein
MGMNMNKLAIPILLCLAMGCSTATPNYDARFGEAVRQARHAMTINPDAGKNADAATGMDGKAATHAMTQYENSFKAPPPVVNVINIGGNIGSSK